MLGAGRHPPGVRWLSKEEWATPVAEFGRSFGVLRPESQPGWMRTKTTPPMEQLPLQLPTHAKAHGSLVGLPGAIQRQPWTMLCPAPPHCKCGTMDPMDLADHPQRGWREVSATGGTIRSYCCVKGWSGFGGFGSPHQCIRLPVPSSLLSK